MHTCGKATRPASCDPRLYASADGLQCGSQVAGRLPTNVGHRWLAVCLQMWVTAGWPFAYKCGLQLAGRLPTNVGHSWLAVCLQMWDTAGWPFAYKCRIQLAGRLPTNVGHSWLDWGLLYWIHTYVYLW